MAATRITPMPLLIESFYIAERCYAISFADEPLRYELCCCLRFITPSASRRRHCCHYDAISLLCRLAAAFHADYAVFAIILLPPLSPC